MSSTRVIIIGSGLFGLTAAKTYLKVDPSISLTILEADSGLGGTWSRDRVYPTLMAQQPVGAYEHPDVPLVSEGQSKHLGTYGNLIPGSMLCEYMEKFARDEGLLDRIIFNTKVLKIEKKGTVEDPHGWDIFVQGGKPDRSPDYTCDKLIVATGQTSEESIPENLLAARSSFVPIIHSKHMGKKYEMLAVETVSRIAIYGAGKSALDAVYMCAKIGKRVDWIIRPDEVGSGATYFAPAESGGQSTNDLISSRYVGKHHPSLLAMNDSWYRFFHSGANTLGYWFNGYYWKYLSKALWKSMDYNKSENGKNLVPTIKPEDRPLWWVNKPLALITQPEVIDWIHQGDRITVHRASITSVSSDSGSITLTPAPSSGSKPIHLPTDALILCTGYKPFAPFFAHSPALMASLGLPMPLVSVPPTIAEKWSPLTQEADKKITKLFPRLASPPPIKMASSRNSPCRLYRYSVPTEYVRHNDRSLVFVGMAGLVSMGAYSLLSSLWGVAWLVGKLKPLENQSMEDIERHVAELSVWPMRRHLNNGIGKPTTLPCETMPVFDMLMRDLGLNPHRKKGWYKEFFEAYKPRDYRGILEEWMANEGLLNEKGVVQGKKEV